jgi:septal ring factor EnvC (AmiA/AmiB activator)
MANELKKLQRQLEKVKASISDNEKALAEHEKKGDRIRERIATQTATKAELEGKIAEAQAEI